MVDFTRIKIGSEVKYVSTKLNKKPKKCKVVDIIKAYQLPDQQKIIKYYGIGIIKPQTGRVFGPLIHDRIVLKRGKKDYIILPISRHLFNYCYLEVVRY